MGTEGGFGRYRAFASRALLHGASVHLPTVAAPEPSPVPVSLRVSEGIAHVTLERPPLNVLDIETMGRLNASLRLCDVPTVRVVVISSALPKAFSAGVDIAEHGRDRVDAMLDEVRENARLLLNMKVPTIAAIHGSTLGGGAELALMCDLVIAADDTIFALPEISLAAFPPIAAAILVERLPWAAGMQLMLGESIDAARAQQLGLIGTVVERTRLDETAAAMARRIADFSGVASRALIAATRGPRAAGVLHRIDEAIATYKAMIGPSRDAQEGIDAFLAKRPPTWSHR